MFGRECKLEEFLVGELVQGGKTMAGGFHFKHICIFNLFKKIYLGNKQFKHSKF